MNIHDLLQGSPEWVAYRARHFNASDAPAMMGCSPYKTRAQLLREMHTGIAPDVDIATQKRFDNGHRAEALARPLAEEIVGEDLYAVTGSLGRLSASFDGLTMDESTVWEHKALGGELRAAFAAIDSLVGGGDEAPGRLLPIHHRMQMEQQLHVSGAGRALFLATEWDADGNLVDQRSVWYLPDEELRGAILNGWDQFAADLAAYVLPEAAEPAPVGKAPDTLPALRIEVTGAVTASNLAEFKATALGAIRSVNRNLRTDQDFADAEKAVRWCADVESRLKAAKEHALSQTADIEALFCALDDISAEARTVRLDLDKLVTRRKTEVKEEAVAKARRALDDHIAGLNAEIAPMRLQPVPADFAGAIKGLKSLASMQDKLDTTLAAAKIEADAAARVIRGNVAAFQVEAAGFEFLFADLATFVHKAADDFRALVTARIATHKADQERKRVEAEKAEHLKMLMSELQGINQQVVIAQIGRAGVRKGGTIECLRETLAETEAWPLDPAHWGDHFERAQAAKAGAVQAIRNLLGQAEQAAAKTSATTPAPAAAPMEATPAAPTPAPARATAAPRADEPATLKLGTICERLGFTVTAAFVGDVLHIKPAKVEGNRPGLYTERQFALICQQLQSHVCAMAELYAADTATA